MTELQSRLFASKEEIFRLFESGESVVSLAKSFGCSCPPMRSFLRASGATMARDDPEEFADRRRSVLDLHAQGLNVTDISRKLGIKRDTVGYYLRREKLVPNVYFKRREGAPLETFADEIVRRYEAGDGSTLIAKAHGCCEETVRKLLIRKGVKMRNRNEYFWKVDRTFFDVIDTEARSYTLGLLMADGCNDTKGGFIHFDQADHEVCRSVAAAMGYEGPIRSRKQSYPNAKLLYMVNFGCRHMSDSLVRLGCGSRKTYDARFQTYDQVPHHLTKHLVRGWFDGDGSVRGHRPAIAASVVGTKEACQGMAEEIQRQVGISPHVRLSKRCKNMDVWEWKVQAHADLVRLANWLYEDATIFMPRKKDVFSQIRKNFYDYYLTRRDFRSRIQARERGQGRCVTTIPGLQKAALLD